MMADWFSKCIQSLPPQWLANLSRGPLSTLNTNGVVGSALIVQVRSPNPNDWVVVPAQLQPVYGFISVLSTVHGWSCP